MSNDYQKITDSALYNPQDPIAKIINDRQNQQQKQKTVLPSEMIQEQIKRNVYANPTAEQLQDLMNENTTLKKQIQKYSQNAKDVKILKQKLEQQMLEMEQFKDIQEKKFEEKHQQKLKEIESSYNYQYSKIIVQINEMTDSSFTDLGHALEFILSLYQEKRRQLETIQNTSKIQLQNQQLTNDMERLTIENQLKFNEIQSLKQQIQTLSQDQSQLAAGRARLQSQEAVLNDLFNRFLNQINASFSQIKTLQWQQQFTSQLLFSQQAEADILKNFMIQQKLIPERRRPLSLRLKIIKLLLIASVRLRRQGAEFGRGAEVDSLKKYVSVKGNGRFQLDLTEVLGKISGEKEQFWLFLHQCGVKLERGGKLKVAERKEQFNKVAVKYLEIQQIGAKNEVQLKELGEKLHNNEKLVQEKEKQIQQLQRQQEEFKNCIPYDKYGNLIAQNDEMQKKIVAAELLKDGFEREIGELRVYNVKLLEQVEELQGYSVSLIQERAVCSDLMLQLKRTQIENEELKSRQFRTLMNFQEKQKDRLLKEAELEKTQKVELFNKSTSRQLIDDYHQRQAAKYNRSNVFQAKPIQVFEQQNKELLQPISQKIQDLNLNYDEEVQNEAERYQNWIGRKHINYNGGRKLSNFDEQVRFVMDKTALGQRIQDLVDL